MFSFSSILVILQIYSNQKHQLSGRSSFHHKVEVVHTLYGRYVCGGQYPTVIATGTPYPGCAYQFAIYTVQTNFQPDGIVVCGTYAGHKLLRSFVKLMKSFS